ncbi:MAG: VacJ family lipoprotein [Methylococcaceae bacterium]|nr:VacJ family lipoprotein [Methylococcaceae bacterium]
MLNNNLTSVLIIVLSFIFLTACTTTGQHSIDPWEDWNRDVQSFNDDLDEHVMRPIAEGYEWIMPSFASQGVSNFFSNIDDIGVTLNDFLQGKFLQGSQDGARFLINSTLGIGGLFDVAAELELTKNNEDFGQTLGVWGLPTGYYMVVPFVGPSSPRGIVGLIGDSATDPISYVASPYISTGLSVLNAIDTRANMLTLGKIADEAALDRYLFFRDSYIARRKYLVYDGEIPDEELEGDFDLDKALDEQLEEDSLKQ